MILAEVSLFLKLIRKKNNKGVEWGMVINHFEHFENQPPALQSRSLAGGGLLGYYS